jgi:hypothetical protein
MPPIQLMPHNYNEWFVLVRDELVEQAHVQENFAKIGGVIAKGTKAEYEARLKGLSTQQQAGGGGGGGGGKSAKKDGKRTHEAISTSAAEPTTTTAVIRQVEKRREKCKSCGGTHVPGCYRVKCGHTCINTNPSMDWIDSVFGKQGAKLQPPMTSLSDTFNTKGEVMALDIRQKLIDARCAANGGASQVAQATSEIRPYGSIIKKDSAPETPAPAPRKQGARPAFCCANPGNHMPPMCITITTTPTPSELCTCVSVLDESPTKFSNQSSVFLSSLSQDKSSASRKKRKGSNG